MTHRELVSPDPNYAARVRGTFERQAVMHLLGAAVQHIGPGEVVIGLPFRADLCQQHGFIHAGIITTIVDSACGGAALSLMPVEAGVLSVEFKINLMSPAQGQSFVARGRVVKPGRTFMVCQGEVSALTDGEEKTIALMQATMMVVENRPGIVD